MFIWIINVNGNTWKDLTVCKKWLIIELFVWDINKWNYLDMSQKKKKLV